MTDTMTRPLPTDWATLKAYLPPEPDDTSATRARLTIANLDAASAAARAELADAERREQAVAQQVYDAANRGDDLATILADWRPARAHTEQRLAVLAAARSIAAHRLAVAERTDPLVQRWRERCDQIRHEWQLAQSADTPEQRAEQLLRFAATH